MSSVPEQEQPFDWEAERQRRLIERRRVARQEILGHYHAYMRRITYDTEVAEQLLEDLRTLGYKEYKGVTAREIRAELRYLSTLELSGRFKFEFDTERRYPSSMSESIEYSATPGYDSATHAILNLSTTVPARGWGVVKRVGHVESATIKLHVRNVRVSAHSGGPNLSMEVDGISTYSYHASSSYAAIERRSNDFYYDQVGETRYQTDEGGLIKSSVDQGGLPALWPVLRRMIREQEVRRSRLTAMTAFDLKVRTSVLRDKRVRLVTTDNLDVVGTISKFTLGRNGAIRVITLGGAEVFVPRSKVRNIVPWEWRDNALNFTPVGEPVQFRSQLS